MESKRKKRILIFIDWFLPGDKAGGPVRSCANLIDHLQDDFDFSVVTRDTDYTESIPYKTIQSDAWNNLPDGKRVYYISAAQLNRETISRLLQEEDYDFIYLNGIWSQPFTVWPLQAIRKLDQKPKVVLAVRGMLAPSAMAIKALKKKVFLAFAKLKGIYSGIVFHATNEKEADETRSVFGTGSTVRVAGNLPRQVNQRADSRATKHEPLRIVSIARIAPEKNTLYAIESLMQVKSRAEVHFFGSIYNEAYFRECKTLSEKLPAHIPVSFPGALESEAIAETLSTYDLLFLPSRGENFGHIILEAMQAGVPVLISDQTPWENLAKEKAGWELSLDAPNAFAEKIDALAAMKNEEYAEWSEGALRFAEKYAGDKKVIEASRALFA